MNKEQQGKNERIFDMKFGFGWIVPLSSTGYTQL